MGVDHGSSGIAARPAGEADRRQPGQCRGPVRYDAIPWRRLLHARRHKKADGEPALDEYEAGVLDVGDEGSDNRFVRQVPV